MGSHKKFVILRFTALTLIAVLFFSMVQAIYSNKITMKSLNSIEIISPFIKQSESQLLKSKFLRIKTCKDYDAFYNEMKILSERHNIKLPLFKPL